MTCSPIDPIHNEISEPKVKACPELLAPAGDSAALRAAVGNGADAVYLGASAFNARVNAANFDPDDLAEAIDYAHLRSVKVYLTLNTLIGDDEGQAALELAAQAYTAGIDAVILQDIGLASILRSRLPGLPLHASTQMTVHDAAGLDAAARLGVSRVILPRELSLPEIADLTALALKSGLQTEVFIHGALCVSYSGQCLLSSMIGARSGNRGACAQPCRLPWQRIRPTGKPMDSGPDSRFPWLSPRDQSMLDYLPQLIAAGVSSLKIEGRMRSSAYVGQVTSIYRAALDRAAGLQEMQDEPPCDRTADKKRQLLLAFNRGGSFTDRYISGRRQADFLSGSHPGSHGMLLGQIHRIEPRQGLLSVMTQTEWPADETPGRGDVLSIRRPGDEAEIASAPIGTITRQGRLLLIKGFHPDALAKLQEGDPVFRMNDRSAEQNALQADTRHTSLAVSCSADAGEIALTAVVMPGQGRSSGWSVTVRTPEETARPLDESRIALQLKKTGGTPFRISQISIAGPVSLSIASLNELRRRLLEDLTTTILRQMRRELPDVFSAEWPGLNMTAGNGEFHRGEPPQASVTAYYLKIPADFSEIACGADTYALPILGLSGKNAPAIIQTIRAVEPDCRVFAWLPAATAGRSAKLLENLLGDLPKWGFDGLYAGNPGLSSLADPCLAKVADQGANIFNQAALAWFAGEGAEAACPSAELDIGRLTPIRTAACQLGVTLELPVYGRLRLMTSEFCPIGQNLPGCRKCLNEKTSDDIASSDGPDDALVWSLMDRRQQAFPVLPHPRVCTSEIFSHFLMAAAPEFIKLAESDHTATSNNQEAFRGIAARLSFLEETPAERRLLTEHCRQLLAAASTAARNARAADFQAIARQVAERLGCQLGNGHYLRGV